jgi:DNA-binding protein HU-beta
MTKLELVSALSESLYLSKKDTELYAHAVLEAIEEAVLGEGRFTWPKFGTWSVRTRKARLIRNPQTGAPIQLPATKTIGFRPAKESRARLKRLAAKR